MAELTSRQRLEFHVVLGIRGRQHHGLWTGELKEHPFERREPWLIQMLNDLEPFTELNPSAENLARYFYDETNRQLNEMTGGRVAVKDCTIWETDATTATYYE